MKKFLLGLAVAAVALFSACENLEPQAPMEQETADAVIFTADLGVDTKTYLESEGGVYKVRWSEGDHFTVYDANDMSKAEDVNLISGAGTSTGTFTGNLKADSYVAYYGYRRNLEGGGMYPSIPQYQGSVYDYDASSDDYVLRDSFGDYYYPMAAVSNTADFAFKNIASIIKVSLKGDKYIKNIVLTPNDKTVYISGNGELSLDGDRPELEMFEISASENFINYSVETDLDPDQPLDFYIVVPAQTYTGGFTLQINSSDGYMDVTTTSDIVMEQSQIRAIPTITYEQEYTNEWGICGTFTNWTTDVEMTFDESGNYYVLKNYYLEAGSEFMFRTNGTWDVNLGGFDGSAVPVNTKFALAQNGLNMYVETSGYYDIYLDVVNSAVYVMETGLAPGTYVSCDFYDEVAVLSDDTYVKVTGYVFATNKRGFILNIGNYYHNCIHVYQGTDQSSYAPVLGNNITVYAQKTTYNALPELLSIQKIVVNSDATNDYGYGNVYADLLDEESFVNFTSDEFIYVKYKGRLEKSGSYYNVYVGDQTDRVGSITYPDQDMTDFLDKEIYVEGYFIGFAGGGKYLNTMAKYISLIDNDGGTEDVTPGDDIDVTKSPLRIR